MRNFVMSDIHGHAFVAQKLIDYAQVDLTQDKMRFLGDYIDRGPDSFGAIRLVRKMQDEGAVVHMGNHEQMLLMHSAGILSSESFMANGGGATIRSFDKAGVTDAQFHDILRWISTLIISDMDDDFVYVHAGINPNKSAIDNDEALWIREEFLNARPEWIRQAAGNRIVVHGHTPMTDVFYDGAKINTDVGAGGRKKLALVELTEGIVYTYDFQQARLNGSDYAITVESIKDGRPVSLY